jgi:flagellar hook-associated protein 3 FlgL
MTRISLVSLNRNVLSANQDNLSRAAELQKQLATGKRINAFSDDPVSAKRSLGYRTERFAADRFKENIQSSLAFYQVTDTALTRMNEIMDEAKAVAVKGATATEDAQSRASLGRQMDGFLNLMIDLGNTVHDGRHVFAGNEVLTEPFQITDDRGRVDYLGDLDSFRVQVGPTSSAEVNANGFRLFKDPVDVFEVFIQIRDRLADNDPEGVEALIDRLDRSQDHLANQQGDVGAKVQRVELTRAQIEEAEVNLSQLISNEEDVDMAETIMNLQTAEVALQAGLNAGARVIQPTLLDFLG